MGPKRKTQRAHIFSLNIANACTSLRTAWSMKTQLFVSLSHTYTQQTSHFLVLEASTWTVNIVASGTIICVCAYVCVGELFIYQVLSNVRVLSAAG